MSNSDVPETASLDTSNKSINTCSRSTQYELPISEYTNQSTIYHSATNESFHNISLTHNPSVHTLPGSYTNSSSTQTSNLTTTDLHNLRHQPYISSQNSSRQLSNVSLPYSLTSYLSSIRSSKISKSFSSISRNIKSTSVEILYKQSYDDISRCSESRTPSRSKLQVTKQLQGDKIGEPRLIQEQTQNKTQAQELQPNIDNLGDTEQNILPTECALEQNETEKPSVVKLNPRPVISKNNPFAEELLALEQDFQDNMSSDFYHHDLPESIFSDKNSTVSRSFYFFLKLRNF